VPNGVDPIRRIVEDGTTKNVLGNGTLLSFVSSYVSLTGTDKRVALDEFTSRASHGGATFGGGGRAKNC
jgi:hypothetical protein